VSALELLQSFYSIVIFIYSSEKWWLAHPTCWVWFDTTPVKV